MQQRSTRILDPTHDHRDNQASADDQNVLLFGIKLDGLAIVSFFERMPDQRLVLVVLGESRDGVEQLEIFGILRIGDAASGWTRASANPRAKVRQACG